MRLSQSDKIIYADAEYKNASAATMQLESALDSYFSENKSSALTLTPILDIGGAIVAEEARFSPPKSISQYISYSQFLQIIGQNGLSLEYYRAIFKYLGHRRKLYSDDRRLCLHMLTAAFIQEDIADKILELVYSSGFEPYQIMFSIDEADIALSLPALNNNIKSLANRGFAFMADSFAEGYTDMALLLSLPLSFIRLHESLLRDAVNNARSSALLKGLLGVLADVGTVAICSGIEDEHDERIAIEAGAVLFQGSYIGRQEFITIESDA